MAGAAESGPRAAPPPLDPAALDLAALDQAALSAGLASTGYLADDGLVAALSFAIALGRPLLLEGEPGVGKTAAATALADALGAPLIRLQCYEGLTASESLYEWNYQRQLLAIRLAEARGVSLAEADVFTADYLQPRPILRAVQHPGPGPAVLLIDEIDRADDQFEALLFEFLAEAAITVPELGTITATHRPIVVLTANRSRELHDALRRRCLYHWIDHPPPRRVAEILRRHVPAAREALIEDVSEFLAGVRGLDLDKPPGLAEGIDWLSVLVGLRVDRLVRDQVMISLGAVVKTPDDIETVLAALDDLGVPAAPG